MSMKKTNRYLTIEPDEVVECCGSCKHAKVSYDCTWFCSISKYKRYYFGKYHIEDMMTFPHYKCDRYEPD